MKRFLAFVLAMMMLCGAALAGEIDEGVRELVLDEKMEIDLDGDGASEGLTIQMVGAEDETFLHLVVEGSDGSVNAYSCELWYYMGGFVLDMNGDGAMEILISGDIMSDDYFTWCLNYDTETGMKALQFADANRGDNTDDYFEYGYGAITDIAENRVSLAGTQDMLGTWMAERTFTLRDGQFELEDGGVWRMLDLTADPEVWEYMCLVLAQDMDVLFEDGSEGRLAAGEKLLITETDKLSYAGFVTEDGRRGTIALEENTEEWGHLINGVSEEEMFEYLPYYD